MSQAEISRFVTRALDDESVRDQLARDPEQAFQGYDLTPSEKSAIQSADEQQLRAFGLDPMTSRSWLAFHDAKKFAPDRPDAPGDVDDQRG